MGFRLFLEFFAKLGLRFLDPGLVSLNERPLLIVHWSVEPSHQHHAGSEHLVLGRNQREDGARGRVTGVGGG